MTAPLLKNLVIHKYDVDVVAFSPDGTILAAAGSPRDYAIRILNTNTWEKTRALRGHKHRITVLTFSPDGTLLASSSLDKTVMLWDLRTGELKSTVTAHRKIVFTVAFSPDGKSMVSGGMNGVAIITDVATGAEIRRSAPCGGYIYSLAYSPDGSTIAIAGGTEWSARDLRLWDLTTGGEKCWPCGHRAASRWVSWSPDGKTIASASPSEIILRDPESGVPRLRFRSPGGGTVAFAFSPDGRIIAASGDVNDRRPDHQHDFNKAYGLIQFWNANSGRLLTEFIGHEKESRGISFSAKEPIAATASLDGTVKIWDVAPVVQMDAGMEDNPQPVTFRIHAYCHRSVAHITPSQMIEGIRERLRPLTYLFCPAKEEDPEKVLERLSIDDVSSAGVMSAFAIRYRSDSRGVIWMNRNDDLRIAMPTNQLVNLGWRASQPDAGASAQIRDILLGTTERVTFFLAAEDVEGMGFPVAIATASYLVESAGGIIQSGEASWMVPEGREVRILGEWSES